MQVEEINTTVLTGIAIMIVSVWGGAGLYWAMEFARGTEEAGTYLWTCVFLTVVGSVLFYFEQARTGGMGLSIE